MTKKHIILAIAIAIAVLLIASAVLFYIENREDVQAFTGEVAYVQHSEINEYDLCFVYLKPKTDALREDWVMFEITKETIFESGNTGILSEASELAVGNTVEITFDKNKSNEWENYKAKSIRIADSQVTSTEELSITPKSDYSFSEGKVGSTVLGEVVHVARIEESSLSGYIVYVNESTNIPLVECWIDASALVDEEVGGLLEQRATGYTVKIQKIEAYPFEHPNSEIFAALNCIIASDQ